jgi:hypothetical protein
MDAAGARTVAPDSVWQVGMRERLADTTAPWWLARPRAGAMFGARVAGVEEGSRPPAMSVALALHIEGANFGIVAPVTYRYADPIRGEMNRPLAGAPAVSVTLDGEVEYVPAASPIERKVRVQVRSAAGASQDVDVTLRVPDGLLVDTSTRRVTLPGPGAQRTITFTVGGRLPAGRHTIDVVASVGTALFTSGYASVDYEHIRPQRMYRSSTMALEAVDVVVPSGTRVAYIPGVGDNSAPMLQQLGVPVTMLEPASLASADLTPYTAVVVGPRAYEANEALVANNARLLEYARNGGTLVVQYGQYEMMQPGIMPYPATINRPHDRVTDETAPVRILDPAARVLNAPNRITPADFEGWVQDRSLYMLRTFDERYRPMLELNDPGEPARQGALVVAPLGQGTYVYTALAFFRQLPDGVPGAARLFVNLLSARAERIAQ